MLLLTKSSNKQLTLDIKKANEQYRDFGLKFSIRVTTVLIIDNVEVYHLGASLKDLRKKWFAFSENGQKLGRNILKQ